MNGELAFLRAKTSDAPQVHALQRAAFMDEARLYGDCNILPLTEPESETLRFIEEHFVLTAIRDGRLAGAVRARMADETCHVGRLTVAPDLQGRGIGTRLVQEIEARFPEAARFEIFTGHKSARNIRLYEKLGYQAFREKPVHEGLTIVFMEKVRAPSSRNADNPCGSSSRRPTPSP